MSDDGKYWPSAGYANDNRTICNEKDDLKMEEYLTINELSNRIKMTPGTIRNLIWKNSLIENVHYVKPTSRKLLFVWSAIEAWLYGKSVSNSVQEKSLINI